MRGGLCGKSKFGRDRPETPRDSNAEKAQMIGGRLIGSSQNVSVEGWLKAQENSKRKPRKAKEVVVPTFI